MPLSRLCLCVSASGQVPSTDPLLQTPSVLETPEEVDAYLRSCESRDSAGIGRSPLLSGSPMSPYRPSPPVRQAQQAAAASPSPAGLGVDAVLRDLHPYPQAREKSEPSLRFHSLL